ncbi:hypothetical protein HWV23_08955 [Natronomonas halophila]|uniref:hypothetical protein n=1 Tax=Natronomonas halophila TaxID=2747817 RepID=UPI0015B72938|nr:hypothetical protein [Natronomonas halophila]QLD85846.1 hypothetical protein HWV23_08955 [Natronomonas halophila]
MSEEAVTEERPDDDPLRPAFLTTVRTEPRKRYTALVVLAIIGLGAAWVHWLGLFVAGALVGLVSRTLPRAVVAGLVVGIAVLALNALASPTMGVGEFLTLTPPAYVAIGAALVLPVWGSLVRGVV